MKMPLAIMLSFLLLLAAACKSKPTPPPKPSLVPDTAVWAGGVDGGSFFECAFDAQHNVNRCLVYNDYTGNVDGGGFFQLSGLNRAALPHELHFRFFDGERISLVNGTLVPVPPIRPDAVPQNAAFKNGLFIVCGKLIAGSTDCSVYRPNGTVYYTGNFAFDHMGGAPAALEYKFFDLSERTIHLIGGGALVPK